uniref:Peptidylprolyl isomerase n=1 Tax=Chrysotila carterae TaxID=13221 RepID=A0A7S4AYP4_CHRCT
MSSPAAATNAAPPVAAETSPAAPPKLTAALSSSAASTAAHASTTEPWEDDVRGYVFEQRLETGEAHKAAGNEHFRRGEWNLALRRYRRALFHAGFDESQMFDLMDRHREMAHAVQIPVKLNLVACILKHRELGIPIAPIRDDDGDVEIDPLDYCEALIAEALKCEPKCAKAYFRRGQLLIERGDLVSANEALLQAEKLQGSASGGIRDALLKVRQLQREERWREKEMFSGVIQPVSDYKAAQAAEERRRKMLNPFLKAYDILMLPLRWLLAIAAYLANYLRGVGLMGASTTTTHESEDSTIRPHQH